MNPDLGLIEDLFNSVGATPPKSDTRFRIAAWNCAMKYQRKASAAASLDADIIILSECGSPEFLAKKGLDTDPSRVLWVGDNPKKGLALIVREPCTIVPLFEKGDEDLLAWVAPVRITNPTLGPIDILAVWSCSRSNRNEKGIFPPASALRKYSKVLNTSRLIIAGDFNHNVRFDRPGQPSKFQMFVEKLALEDLESAYHVARGCAHGEEPDPTLYWRTRKKNGLTYHIDYIFAPRRWLRDAIVEVGSFEDWIGTNLSDHVPIVCSFTKQSLQ